MRNHVHYLTRILNRSLTTVLLFGSGALLAVAGWFVPDSYRAAVFGFHEYLAYLLFLQIVALAHVQLLDPNLVAWRFGKHPSRIFHATALHLAILPYLVLSWLPMVVGFYLESPSTYAFMWASLVRFVDLVALGLVFSLLHLLIRHSLAAFSVLILVFVVLPNQLASKGVTIETGWPILGHVVEWFRFTTALGSVVDHLVQRDFLHAMPLAYALVWIILIPILWLRLFRNRPYH